MSTLQLVKGMTIAKFDCIWYGLRENYSVTNVAAKVKPFAVFCLIVDVNKSDLTICYNVIGIEYTLGF